MSALIPAAAGGAVLLSFVILPLKQGYIYIMRTGVKQTDVRGMCVKRTGVKQTDIREMRVKRTGYT